MAERLPRFSLVVCSAGLAVMAAALVLGFLAGAPPGNVLAILPPLWLWLAALLNRTETGHAAYAVSTAGLFNLLLGVGLLLVEYQRWATGQRALQSLGVDKLLVLPQFPVALTAVVPAVVGWRVRRHERLIDDD